MHYFVFYFISKTLKILLSLIFQFIPLFLHCKHDVLNVMHLPSLLAYDLHSEV